MVFVPLDVRKILCVCAAIHHGGTVKVVCPSIHSDHGVAERPAYACGFSVLPGLYYGLGELFHKELGIFRSLHNTFIPAYVIKALEGVVDETRSCVGMGGIQKQFADIKIGNLWFHQVPQAFLDWLSDI